MQNKYQGSSISEYAKEFSPYTKKVQNTIKGEYK